MLFWCIKVDIIMLKSIENIPEEYVDEFCVQQIAFIKSRVYLFCALSIVIYFCALLMEVIINPSDFRPVELLVGSALIVSSLLIIYLNYRAKTLNIAKFNAYLFTALLLMLLVQLSVEFQDNPIVSSSFFVFTLFLVATTIPWRPRETVPIWIMHLIAFTGSFLFVKSLSEVNGSIFSLREYIDGAFFISLAFGLCLVVRNRETARDIENFVLLKKIETKNTEMQKDLEWATRVHKTIIPKSLSTDKVDIAVTYLPVYYIGGDYTRFNFVDHDNKLIFIISDVTGHGVPSALLVNRIHAEFERLAKEGKDPGVLLKELNVFIKEDFEGSGMYLSAFCGMLDFKKKRLLYSSYGHPTQYLYSEKEARLHKLSCQTSLLGLPSNDDDVYQDEIEIAAEDKVLLFTDGVIETVNAEDEEYGNKRVEKFIKKNHALEKDDFNKELIKEVNAFKEGKFKDDICIMSIGIKAQPSFFPWK